MSIVIRIVSITNINAIASSRMMHAGYLLYMKVCASAGTLEEQLIGNWLITMK